MKRRSQSAFAPLPCLLAFACITLSGAVVAPPQGSRVVLQDDFETYTNTEDLQSAWTGGTAVLETNVPGGGSAAFHEGGDLNSSVSFSVQPDATHNVVFSADIFDSATNAAKRVTVALRNLSGANMEFGFIYETLPYAVRVVGFAGGTNWISFDPALQPARGWNRFQAIISLTNTIVTLDLGADGKIDKLLKFDGPAPAKPFASIRFGGLPGRKSHGGPVLIDNIRLTLEPMGESLTSVPATMGGKPPALNARTADTPAALPSLPAASSPHPAVPPVQQPTAPVGMQWWILGAMGVIILLLAGVLLVLRRNARPASSVPALSSTSLPPAATGGVPLLTQDPSIRERAVAELAEFAKQSLVQGLYSQRLALVELQQKAQQDIAQLETRLAALHLPLQERIRAYEQRISELEKELNTHDDEMRELTRMTLRLVREKLETERTRDRLN